MNRLCPNCFSKEIAWAERSPEGRSKCGACGFEGKHSEWKNSIEALTFLLKEAGLTAYYNPFYDSKNAAYFGRLIKYHWKAMDEKRRADQAVNVAVVRLEALKKLDDDVRIEYLHETVDEIITEIQTTYRGGINAIQTADHRNDPGEIRSVQTTDGSNDSEIRTDPKEIV